MITEKQFQILAKQLCVEPAAIKAVAQVESGGSGIIDGKPVILFEPHVFWKQLREKEIDPVTVQKGNEDILYPVWGSKPYPKGQAAQYERMDRAAKINRTAALQSCSWGKFQIMGYHWKTCGAMSLQDFVNKMYESEDMHLHLFTNYIKNTFLDDELREKDWKGFARGYNGALYAKNKYDTKLAAAYKSFL